MDKTRARESRDAADNTRNATDEARTSRTGYAGDKTVDGEAEHASCATAEARATEYSAGTFAKSTAAEADADAALYATSEAYAGNEAGAAFESVHSAGTE